MAIRTANTDKETDEIFEKMFGKGSGKERDFSKWVREKLIDLGEERYDLPTLQRMVGDIKLKIKQDKLRYKELCNKIKVAEKLQKIKFKLNDKEVIFLKETKKLIKSDSSKFYPRMKVYSNEFSKEVNEEEFLKLMDLAEKTT
jgi:hypothetical protein